MVFSCGRYRQQHDETNESRTFVVQVFACKRLISFHNFYSFSFAIHNITKVIYQFHDGINRSKGKGKGKKETIKPI